MLKQLALTECRRWMLAAGVLAVGLVVPGLANAVPLPAKKVVPTFLAAPGNIAFDIFQDASDPDTMVQLERWTNADTHNANLKRPVIGEIRGLFSQTLAKPLMSHRALLKDVSVTDANG